MFNFKFEFRLVSFVFFNDVGSETVAHHIGEALVLNFLLIFCGSVEIKLSTFDLNPKGLKVIIKLRMK